MSVAASTTTTSTTTRVDDVSKQERTHIIKPDSNELIPVAYCQRDTGSLMRLHMIPHDEVITAFRAPDRYPILLDSLCPLCVAEL